jgi:glutamate-1-semialdehyde aminotransferase
MALGPIVLGYNHPAVNEAVHKQVELGSTFSLGNHLEVEVAEVINQMVPCAEQVRFLKTGSEATSAAVRIARAATGRDHVAMCGYHGWHDWAVGHTARNAGVPTAVSDLTHQWSYNDLSSLEEVLAGEHVAAVIMEPVGVVEPEPGFLENVKRITHDAGALLIFDEVITGFRLAAGGAQEYFGVVPDLATFGKAMANGYPLAAVAGGKLFMEHISRDAFISSTFGGETVSLAAALATMITMQTEPVFEHLWRQGTKLANGFNDSARRHEAPLRMVGLGPRRIVEVSEEVSRPNVIKGLLWQECLDRGVLMGNANFVSLAHGDDAVATTLDAFDEALRIVAEANISGDEFDRLRGKPPREVWRRP